MTPRGRPPAERNVYSFEGLILPPDELVLETSFVVDALIPSQARHVECRTFLEAVAGAQSTVVFNRLLEPELWEAAYKIALAELHPRPTHRNVRRDRRTLVRAKALQREIEQAWSNILGTLTWLPVELGEVAGRVPEMMGYGLMSSDAVHAATAVYADVRPFVTLDYDFASVPGRHLQLFVPGSRVRACRERRRGR